MSQGIEKKFSFNVQHSLYFVLAQFESESEQCNMAEWRKNEKKCQFSQQMEHLIFTFFSGSIHISYVNRKGNTANCQPHSQICIRCDSFIQIYIMDLSTLNKFFVFVLCIRNFVGCFFISFLVWLIFREKKLSSALKFASIGIMTFRSQIG